MIKVVLGKEELRKLNASSTQGNLEPMEINPTPSTSTVSSRPTPQDCYFFQSEKF